MPFLVVAVVQAAKTFLVRSPEYSLTVRVTPDEGSEDDPIRGGATLTIKSRKTGQVLQTLRLESVAIFPKQLATSVAKGGKQPALYDDQYSFVFEDFNFDGHADLAVCKDIQGSYGAMQYDIFVFDPKRSRFVRNAALSRLASEHLGLPSVDARRHELEVVDKSGAAWHQFSTYRLRGNRPYLVQQVTEDGTDGVHLIVETRTLTHGKWHTKTVKKPLPDE